LNGCTNMVGSEKVERMYQHGGIREGWTDVPTWWDQRRI
jgi:hypothetical protein